MGDLRIRRLPGKKGTIMSKDKFPPNNVFYNPTEEDTGTYVSLRNSELKPTHEYSHFALYNKRTETLRRITVPDHVLLPTYSAYRGLEDVRIINWNNKIWFTCTCTHASKDMRNVLLLGYLNDDHTTIEHINILKNFQPPTKNVSPFVMNGDLYLLDTFGSMIFTVKKDEGTGEYIAQEVLQLRSAKGISSKRFRGSTSPVHLHGNTWGYVVHDVIYNDSSTMPGSKLSYVHYWVEADFSRGVITFISSPFWCMHWGIEFISGIRYDRNTNEINLYLGIKDELPSLCTCTLHDLRCGK